MGKINEIKEQKSVVKSVGDFANSLQQISAARMSSLRKSVLASRRFVDEVTLILRELRLEQRYQQEVQLKKVIKNYHLATNKHAIIVMSSNQGLCGSYNTEIIKKLDTFVPQHFPNADYFVLGSKAQDYFRKMAKKHHIKFFPYNVPEKVEIDDLRALIRMFSHYDKINLVYSKYINPITRDIVFVELTIPQIDENASKDYEPGKYLFEPSLDQLINNVSAKLRYALFRQQLLDSRLSLYAAQMIAMQTAADNAKDLLKDLQKQYNKERRKLIDKKIQEVQAGRSLWAD